jgi:cytochrome bd-type quinol oxidase subunit 1
MRHIVLFVLATATAYWLGPYAHTLTQKQRYIEMAAIFTVFFAIDFVIGRARRKPASRSGASPYAVPAKRR